ncbi:ABC transporter ATP-binding protein [Catonella morbi]|nr:ABC transporter ATP-binding protein [Catonella morbi]
MGKIKYVLLLSKYIKNYRLSVIFSIIVHALYKVVPILLSFETALIVSKGISGTLTNPQTHFLTVLAMVVSMAVLNYLDIYVAHDVAYRILTALRGISYEKIANLAPAGLEGEKSGDIMSVVLEDVEILEWFYAHSLIQIFVAAVLPIISFIAIGFFSPGLSLILIIFSAIILLVSSKKNEKADEYGSKTQSKLGELNAVIIDGIQGLKEIITFGGHKGYFNKMYKYNDAYNEAYFNYAKEAVKEVTNTNLIIGISSVISAIASVYFAARGEYSVEFVLPLIAISSMVYSPLSEMLMMKSNYGRIFAAARRVFDFLNEDEPVINSGTKTFKDVMGSTDKKLEFNSVRFSYKDKVTGDKNEVIKDVSLTTEEGKTVVLVGTSGSGKSTLIKLLQRFWDVDGGSILINGVNIKDIKIEELRKLISAIPQDVYLFNKSIEDNLRLAKEGASEGEIETALKNAHIMDLVNRLPNGSKTVIGERGAALSGGEKQRISIAQAFLKDSPILIMDEITANLDYENERAINESLKELKKGKIALMIAHRLSTIKSADYVAFIKDGVCEAFGTFAEIYEGNENFRRVLGEGYESV